MERTLYYSDEINDDFAATRIKHRKLKSDYRYFNRGVIGMLLKLFL